MPVASLINRLPAPWVAATRHEFLEAVGAGQHHEGRDAAHRAAPAHTVTCGLRAASFFGPIPGIWVRSLIEEKPPCCWR